jgi:hypothetical protein
MALERAAFGWNRHCEERSDEAIQRTWARYGPLDCFASLAMTIAVRPKCNLLSSCWSAARLGAAAVMAAPGLRSGGDPAIHAAPPQMSPGSGAANGARASGTKRFDLAAPLRSFSAPKHVDGRDQPWDEPGHDASSPFAPPRYPEFLLPTTSTMRVCFVLRKNGKCGMHFSSPD